MSIRASVLIVFLLVFIIACKKEIVTVVQNVPVVHSWLFDSSLIGYNKILLTATPINDSVLAASTNQVIWFVNVNQLNKGITGNAFNPNPVYGYPTAPSITNQIGVTLTDSNHLNVFSILSPLTPTGSFTFMPTYSTSSVSIKGLPLPTPPGTGYPIVNSKYILLPKEIDYTAKKAYLNLLQVNQFATPVNYPQINSVSLTSSKEITITPEASTIGFANGIYFSAAFFGKFFLTYASQFYRVDTLGNVKAFGYSPSPTIVNGRVEQMFYVDNNLFTIGISKISVSQDKGETWSQFADISGTLYGSLKYLNVGSELYATFQSQIFRVTLTGSNLNFKELDNDGLETSQITSINKVGKYAFVTTLSGLFYRDTASFNNAKK